MINYTFCISGTLKKDVPLYPPPHRYICHEEIEASTPQAAADHFEVDGWVWFGEPEVRMITEAVKMERAGEPSLFDLGEVR